MNRNDVRNPLSRAAVPETPSPHTPLPGSLGSDDPPSLPGDGPFRDPIPETVPETPPGVTLNPGEMYLGTQVGMVRHLMDMNEKTRQPAGPSRNQWRANILGALGECAVARHLNVFWSGSLGNFKAVDVGPFQVRTTENPDGRLLLRDSDDPHQAFILVCADRSRFTLLGWLWAHEGQLPIYLEDLHNNQPPCYLVPRKRLHRMSDLPDMKRPPTSGGPG